MTDEQTLRLSAFQDGELDTASASRLLDDLGRDPTLRATWERYHLIGQALRREPIALEHRAVAERVRRAIAQEPTVLAPRRLKPLQRLKRSRPVGLAVAATLALVGVVSAPILFQEAGEKPVGLAPSPLASTDAPAQGRWHLDRPDVANKLDLFLVTHQATAPTTGAKGMLPYATLVGYESSR